MCRMSRGLRFTALLWAALLAGCGGPCAPTPVGAGPCGQGCRAVVVAVYPHDPAAFTQGLQLDGGVLYESTGIEGESTLRRVTLATGAVEQARPLDAREFGEGLAVAGDRIVQLTWKHGRAYVYDKATFDLIETWRYDTEGWGLAYDGTRFIMSDGSATLTFRSAQDFSVLGRVEVRDANGLVRRLNELEVIDGLIYANVWQTDTIVIIDPADGRVRGRIGLTGLLSPADRTPQTDVLNGIAHDPATGHLLVTGKRWPKLFEIRLEEIAKGDK